LPSKEIVPVTPLKSLVAAMDPTSFDFSVPPARLMASNNKFIASYS